MNAVFAKSLIAIPLALSVPLGVASCSTPPNFSPPSISAVVTTPDEKTLNENIAATMTSLATAITSEKNAKTLRKLKGPLKNDKIWNSLDPYIDIDLTDPKVLAIFSAEDSIEDAADVAKYSIIMDFAAGFISQDYYEKTTDNPYAGSVLEYSSIEKFDSGNIKPKNQTFVIKDDNGVITKVPFENTEFIFNADGTKIVYDSDAIRISEFESKVDTVDDNLEVVVSIVSEYLDTNKDLSQEKLNELIEMKYANDLESEFDSVMKFSYDKKTKEFDITMSDPTDENISLSYNSINDFDPQSEELRKTHWEDNLLREVVLNISATTPEMLDNNKIQQLNDSRSMEMVLRTAKIDKSNSTVKLKIDNKSFIFKVPVEFL